jgi:hypothetical protein
MILNLFDVVNLKSLGRELARLLAEDTLIIVSYYRLSS